MEMVPSDFRRTREELLATAGAEACFDVVIIGGGIHGAACARSAVDNGLRVLLLEKADYAAGTSTRSSKMAHGGLRYLEMFDFEQVFEGIKAREEMFTAAPHIVSPTRFLIPVPKGGWFFTLKLGLGLFLYDLMVRDKRRKHRFLKPSELKGTGFEERQGDLSGCFSYTDGLLNDGLLTLENIIAARLGGAVCLNYAGVTELREDTHGVQIRWRDELTGREIASRGARVLNCAGPWAPFLVPAKDRPAVRFSRGTHLLFDRPWYGPSLFLPMEGKARYYFVWPHPAGTMVGTTERETDSLELDPLPGADEIEEILARLEKDLPSSGLDRTSLHYAFAGIRTLPVRPNAKAGTTRLSRKHIWHRTGRVSTLIGGKLTTAAWTAEEGVAQIVGMLGRGAPFKSTRAQMMPRALVSPAVLERFSQRAVNAGLTDKEIRRLVARFGPWVDRLEGESLKPLPGGGIVGEIELALDLEQAESIEDLFRRRLNLEFLPGNGLAALPRVIDILHRHRPERSFAEEGRRYTERIASLRNLMGIGSQERVDAAVGA